MFDILFITVSVNGQLSTVAHKYKTRKPKRISRFSNTFTSFLDIYLHLTKHILKSQHTFEHRKAHLTNRKAHLTDRKTHLTSQNTFHIAKHI